MSAPAIVWFRRDLRLSDLPTLLTAAEHSSHAVAVFVLDDALLAPSGAARKSFLAGCLRALDADLGGRLLVTSGDPARVIPELAATVGATSVHISSDHGPYGATRDRAVESALPQSISLVRTGSPYAVTPGRIFTSTGGPYKVFTPFRRAWIDHGWHAPADTGRRTLEWIDPSTLPGGVDVNIADELPDLPEPGEAAALERWQQFVAERLGDYADSRDRPDLDATSGMSPYLKFGCIHPRTMLRDLQDVDGDGAATLRSELAWRDFYADVLHHNPRTARANFNAKFDAIEYDSGPSADAAFDAWCVGKTGYPIVDAGMRQLNSDGWMHNRVRMIVASFLTKDLHLPWWRGARYFMTRLVDGDLASNQHGWQWTAGCGTDAAPYFRIFNPITQGTRFDPSGDYVRRWVPELRHIPGKAVHTPRSPDALDDSTYPLPIVDHRIEREVALARYGVL